MLNKVLRSACLCVIGLGLFLALGGCGREEAKETVTISVLHYYNGTQQKAFEGMVKEFNETVGKEEGIIVESFSPGGVESVLQVVLDAADRKVGAIQMPDICSAYSDTAYQIYQRGLTADIASYFTEEERSYYVEGYLKEGEFAEGELTIFPIAKATEVLVLNKTDWDRFSEATGIGVEELETWEGLVSTAGRYYEWTAEQSGDSRGKAFFGRDAMANYFFAASSQLGEEILTRTNGQAVINFDQTVIRRIWDNFYIPYIKGFFYKEGRFSSDDMSSGRIIAYVGSSSGASYVPLEVMIDDNDGYPVETIVLPCPVMEGGRQTAIQQGAGMVVLNNGDRRVEASVRFLKWFTEGKRNVEFAETAGYLPVICNEEADVAFQEMLNQTRDENSGQNQAAKAAMAQVSMQITHTWNMYTPPAVMEGNSIRAVLEDSLLEKAQADREAILQSVSSGVPEEEAIVSYLNDDNYNDWYNKTKAQIEAVLE